MKELRFTSEDNAALCSELSYLLHAGMGNADALSIIAEDEVRDAYKKELLAMAAEADEGRALSEIFAAKKSIPEFISKMLSVGEKTGRVKETLDSLAATCESRAETEKRLKSSLLYPAVLMLIMLAVIAVILVYVLPVFNTVYAQLGGSLTGVAGGLLSFGQVLGRIMPVLLALFCAAVVFLALFSAVPSFRAVIIERWKKRKGNKGLAAKMAAAEFAEAMTMAVSSGMSMEDAVRESAAAVSGTPGISEKLEKCVSELEKSGDAAQALKESQLLPPGQCRILEAGIKGGAGEKALEQIAGRLKADSEDAMENALSSIEPAMVIISSVLVGFILLAVMFPLINIMSAIG